LHRVGRRLGFRFVTGSASSFPVCTGLADTAALPIFASPRFWSCYRPPRGFPLKVRPFALKGQLLPTFPCFTGIQLAVSRRTLKRLVHLTDPFFLGQAQPETVPSPPKKERAFHPHHWKSGAFRRRTLVIQARARFIFFTALQL
jgi:hypothetical protein